MAAPDPNHKIRLSKAARLCIGYGAIAGLWIFVSDALIKEFSPSITLGIDHQIINSLIFVVGSSAALYVLLRGNIYQEAAPPVTKADGALDGGTGSTPLWHQAGTPLLIFFLLATAIAFAGFLLYRHETALLKKETDAELRVAVERKADEVAAWVNQNRNIVQLIAFGSFFARELASWIVAGPAADDATTRLLQARLESARDALGFAAAAVLDVRGHPLLGTSALAADHPKEQELAAHAVQAGTVVVSDLRPVVGPDGTSITAVDVAAPVITVPETDAKAALLFRIDAARSLFPLLRRWPSPNLTGQFVLVRQDNSDVPFTNELRHSPDVVMQMRASHQNDVESSASLESTSQIVRATGNRSIEVLSASQPIPGTGWQLIAQADASEVYGPVRRALALICIVAGLFITAAGIGVALWWQQQRALFQARQLRDRIERESLLRHFEFLSRYANDIIVMIDAGGRIIEANARAEREYGYPRDQFLNMDIGIVGESRRSGFNPLEDGCQTDEGVIYEAWHHRKDGSQFPVEVSSRLVELEGRQFRQYIIRDISERVAAEAKTRELHDQLRRISTSNILGEMISVLTHELKQPLTAGLNYINASRRWSGDEAGRALHQEVMLGKAAEQIRRADQFVRKLREFIQKRDAEFDDVSLVPLIERTIDLALLDGIRFGVASRFEHDPDLPPVHIDAVQIQQVLINLLRNAVEAMTDVDAPFIIVNARIVAGNQVEVSVRDNGPGLPPEAAAQIFQPFVSTKAGGIGMGLFICSGIIQAHGGRLWWETDAASGWTAFRFTLPVSAPNAADAAGDVPE